MLTATRDVLIEFYKEMEVWLEIIYKMMAVKSLLICLGVIQISVVLGFLNIHVLMIFKKLNCNSASTLY